MIRHIVSWNLKEAASTTEKRENAEKMKRDLESLHEIVPGIIAIEVILDVLPTSNHDVVLYSLFESVETLAAYQIHPEHVRVSNWASSVVENRICVDFEV
ncbi:Dabb family protein [Enterococcus sp. HY326]|uniref:Dabb family protein n=1 Tax=Enterococcus sp. HY326 TaxID=2971265 RepID=UPI0022409250|nr:Dabb family protein [Enterococcus sp. HY326]